MRLLLALGALGATLLLSAGSASACSCAAIPAEEQFKLSDAAIVGKLIEVVPVDQSSVDHRYRVKDVFQGEKRLHLGDVISVRTGIDSGVCGLPTSKRLGIFLDRNHHQWQGGLCGAVSPGEMADAAEAAGKARAAPGSQPGC